MWCIKVESTPQSQPMSLILCPFLSLFFKNIWPFQNFAQQKSERPCPNNKIGRLYIGTDVKHICSYGLSRVIDFCAPDRKLLVYEFFVSFLCTFKNHDELTWNNNEHSNCDFPILSLSSNLLPCN